MRARLMLSSADSTDNKRIKDAGLYISSSIKSVSALRNNAPIAQPASHGWPVWRSLYSRTVTAGPQYDFMGKGEI